MIARLAGKLIHKADYIIVDVYGVGYEVFVSAFTARDLPELGKDVLLRIYTHVREDTLQLYGFLGYEEHGAFKALINVNGIGPRMALQILSQVTPQELAVAVTMEDKTWLRKVKGFGDKKAGMLVLELKDKLKDLVCDSRGASVFTELQSALANMGFAPKEIDYALSELRKTSKTDSTLGLDKLLPMALQLVTKKR